MNLIVAAEYSEPINHSCRQADSNYLLTIATAIVFTTFMKQLRDAMIKAGLVSKDVAEPKKRPKKSRPPKKEFKKFHEHHVRTDCELCGKYSPDVEYYKHNNKLIVKRWLCIKCADENRISDILRETHQSPDAKAGRFNRTWGKTKLFRK